MSCVCEGGVSVGYIVGTLSLVFCKWFCMSCLCRGLVMSCLWGVCKLCRYRDSAPYVLPL